MKLFNIADLNSKELGSHFKNNLKYLEICWNFVSPENLGTLVLFTQDFLFPPDLPKNDSMKNCSVLYCVTFLKFRYWWK